MLLSVRKQFAKFIFLDASGRTVKIFLINLFVAQIGKAYRTCNGIVFYYITKRMKTGILNNETTFQCFQ